MPLDVECWKKKVKSRFFWLGSGIMSTLIGVISGLGLVFPGIGVIFGILVAAVAFTILVLIWAAIIAYECWR